MTKQEGRAKGPAPAIHKEGACMKNWMTEKLLPHVGHEISCVAYGDCDDPSDVRIECEDCYTVLVSAEDFNQDMAGDYKITQRLRIGGRTLLMGHNPEDKEAP